MPLNSKKSYLFFLPLVFLMIAGIIFFAVKPNFSPKTKEAPELEFQPKELPTELKEKESEIANLGRAALFEVISHETQNPQITEVKIDPQFPEIGEKQFITVWVKDKDNLPITAEDRVEIKVFTDDREYEVSTKLKETTGPTDYKMTVWQGEWAFQGTIENHYLIEINAMDNKGRNHLITITIK